MKIRMALAGVAAAFLISTNAHSFESLEIKNAREAMLASFRYLNEHYAEFSRDNAAKIQEKTIYSEGPVDLVTTSKQFQTGGWSIEVSQSFAPLRNIVYQVTVFNPKLGWHWKGLIKADGRIMEKNRFRKLSEEEREKTAEEFLRKSKIPPPRGGYGRAFLPQ
jgi:hypothetical protein